MLMLKFITIFFMNKQSSSVRITKRNGSAANYLWAFVKHLHSVEIM